MSESIAERNAASVFPEPVGAAMSVFFPSRIGGQPSRCGAVGSPRCAANQFRTAGWKGARRVTGSPRAILTAASVGQKLSGGRQSDPPPRDELASVSAEERSHDERQRTGQVVPEGIAAHAGGHDERRV